MALFRHFRTGKNLCILCTVTICAFVISTIGEILSHENQISPIVEMTKKAQFMAVLSIEESESDTVILALAQAETVATCVISYVETHAAFARLHREQIFTDEQFEIVKREFVEDWEAYFQIPLTQSVRQRAAQLAEMGALRAYDSVQLAAAEILFKQSGQFIIFASFDQRLNKAASQLGLKLLSEI